MAWPAKKMSLEDIKPFRDLRGQLMLGEWILLRENCRIVAPAQLPQKIINDVHEGHPGIGRTKRRLKELYMYIETEKVFGRLGITQRPATSTSPINNFS